MLPVANDEGLRLTVLTGLLLNCSVPPFAKFDRKNYFYPDMPKNLCKSPSTTSHPPSARLRGISNSTAASPASGITRRASREEDVGKNFYISTATAGKLISTALKAMPLLEIVSEPDITGPDMAYEYLQRPQGHSRLRAV